MESTHREGGGLGGRVNARSGSCALRGVLGGSRLGHALGAPHAVPKPCRNLAFWCLLEERKAEATALLQGDHLRP